MKNLYFDDFEDFACVIADKFDELDTEEFEDISVIAKYDEVKEVFKELVCIGYDICSITLDMPDRYGYNDEYILSLSNDGLWIEKFKRENGYFEDKSTVIYVLDNCSSKIIPYCKGKTVYEVAVGEEDCECDECECACCKDEKSAESKPNCTDNFVVKVKCDLDAEEAKEIITDMEKRIERMNDMFREMDEFRKLFRW